MPNLDCGCGECSECGFPPNPYASIGRPPPPRPWFVYMIQCGDSSFYFGITTNVDRRFKEHSSGGKKAAKYTRGRGPLTLIHYWEVRDRGAATKLELRYKKMSRKRKLALAESVSKVTPDANKIPPPTSSFRSSWIVYGTGVRRSWRASSINFDIGEFDDPYDDKDSWFRYKC